MTRATQEDWNAVVEKLEKQTKEGYVRWHANSDSIFTCTVLGWTLMLEKMPAEPTCTKEVRLRVIRNTRWMIPHTPHTYRLYRLVVSQAEMAPEFASAFAADYLKKGT